MRARLPPLNALRLFEAAARLLSFKNAAEELFVTPSAVSHGIQSLEQWLGAPLFLRTTKGLVLSEVGKAYVPTIRHALDLLSRGPAEIASKLGLGQLSISTLPTFAARWLLPRLSKFRELHPETLIVLNTAVEPAELLDSCADLSIRMGRGNWHGVLADKLLSEELVPVCSPAVRERLRDFSSMEESPLIHVTTVSEDWEAWATKTGHPKPDLAKGMNFDTVQLAFEAAYHGLGVAIGRKPLINAELAAGRLVEVWESVPSNVSYWLIFAEDRADDPRITAFRSWVLQEAMTSGCRFDPEQNGHTQLGAN